MKRHLWNLSRLWRGAGLPGWTAVALLGVCVAMVLGGIAPQRAETHRLLEDSAALEQRIAANSAHPAPVQTTPQQQLAVFLKRFPSEAEMAGAVGALNAAAKRQGVHLNQAELKFSIEPSGLLARYSIVLPVKADYRALRGFIREAMRELPGLAMEELNLRRSDAKSTVLEAQLSFVLFVAKPTAQPRLVAAAPSLSSRPVR
jgi:Tfp pilus assembly protein PilO